jgi:integrase
VTGGVLLSNPAGSVRGPKYAGTRGKTPVLSGGEMRQLLNSIDTSEFIGLRDRALLGLMGYTFARVSAVVTLQVEDYFQQGRRSWVRLHEKGGKRHEVPCHHSLDEYLDAWIAKEPIILTDQLIPPPALVRAGLEMLPAAIVAHGQRAGRRFSEFFTATIRNRNTGMAYARAVKRFFDWCDEHYLGLEDIEPIAMAAYKLSDG